MTEANTQTTTTEKRTPVRYKSISEMNETERAAYDKLTPFDKLRHEAKLQKQQADDKLKELKAQEDVTKAENKAKREKETKIKNIVNEVKGGTLVIEKDGVLQTEVLAPKLDAIGIPKDEQAALMEQIQKDSKKSQPSLTPPRPTWTLSRSLGRIKKENFIVPNDGNRPDVTLTNSVRKYGIIYPFLVRQVIKPNPLVEGEFITDNYIADGKRRYWLLAEGEEMDCIIISGFPSELVAQKAEIVVNRVRSLNALSTADALQDMKTRGIEDGELRSDLGFKTGEIQKLLSILDTLITPLQDILRKGNMTPAVAFSIAKLPKNLQETLNQTFIKRVSEGGKNNRVTEADVDGLRQERTNEALARDESLLNSITGGVNNLGDETKTAAGGVANAAANMVDSKSQTSGEFWQEKAFVSLETLREQIPQDAAAGVKRVQTAFETLVTAIRVTSTETFAAEPEFLYESKGVKDWQKKGFKALGEVGKTLDAAEDVPDTVYQALDELNKALQGK